MFDEPGFQGKADLENTAVALATFVYCSRASEGVNDVEVDRIIQFSQRRNVARGITGLLVFGSGVFFQWIEGPTADVQNLIASLLCTGGVARENSTLLATRSFRPARHCFHRKTATHFPASLNCHEVCARLITKFSLERRYL